MLLLGEGLCDKHAFPGLPISLCRLKPGRLAFTDIPGIVPDRHFPIIPRPGLRTERQLITDAVNIFPFPRIKNKLRKSFLFCRNYPHGCLPASPAFLHHIGNPCAVHVKPQRILHPVSPHSSNFHSRFSPPCFQALPQSSPAAHPDNCLFP